MNIMKIEDQISIALKNVSGDFLDGRPNTQRLHDVAKQSMPGGNTRTVLYHHPIPLRIERGEGAEIHDVDGHRYIDFLGEYTAGLFGHSHPTILAAVHQAVDQGLNLGAHNVNEAKLATLVTQRFQAIEKVRFTNSGTEANLMAVSTSRYASGRQKVMVFDGGYHGAILYFGGGGIPINAPFPYVVSRYNDVKLAEQLFDVHGEELACVLVEPMLGSGGCIPGHPEFLRTLRALCNAHGTHLIFDEVMTSRFATSGAHGMLNIKPDLITLGKWVGGGMSFGAFGGRAELLDIYDPSQQNAMPHAGTFNNNTLSMAGGIAALSEAFTPQIAYDLHGLGEQFRQRINKLFTKHNANLVATGQGSLINIHGMAVTPQGVEDLAHSDKRLKELLFFDLLNQGYYIANRGFIALSLAITDEHIGGFIESLDKILTERRSLYCRC